MKSGDFNVTSEWPLQDNTPQVAPAVHCGTQSAAGGEDFGERGVGVYHLKPLMIRDYFNSLAEELAVKGRSSSMGGHRADVGSNREQSLINILNAHLPDRLSAVSGGTVLNLEGLVSGQIDVIVKNDLFPKFDHHHKTAVITESVAGVISVKSRLDKAALEDSIRNVCSVPDYSTETLELSNSSILREDLQRQFMQNWPWRAVFAYEGLDPNTIYHHAMKFYNSGEVPQNRLPDMIVINKKICIRFLRDGGKLHNGTKLPPNSLHPLLLTNDTCGYPIAGMITELNNYIPWMHYMKFNFSPYIDRAFASDLGA